MLVILAVAIEYLNFKCSWYLLKPIAFYVSQISKAISGLLNSPKKRTKLTILRIFFTQDSEFRSFFWRTNTVKDIPQLSDLKGPGTSKLDWRYFEYNKIDRNDLQVRIYLHKGTETKMTDKLTNLTEKK